MKIDNYKHISLDLWLTLIRSHPDFKRKRNVLFKEIFSINQSIDEVEKIFRKYDLTINSINEKTGKNIDTDEIIWFILYELKGLGLKENKIKVDEFMKEMNTLFLKYPPVVLEKNLFENLKLIADKNITLNITSNTGFIKGKIIKNFLDSIKLKDYFSFLLFSDELNISKPNPKIFKKVWENCNQKIDKSEVLHIGDNPIADELGAKSFGFSTYLYSQTNNLEKLIYG